ncbi:hypothetical protein F53441_11606 [Fusarium austroafricanum]|uniref:Uncharacterized protein n=1 Tax=Fusarium austroafricanum TaxID=2364996 RepID=A0A8H4K3J0_9HYPO|nr:hypothetical protein F53441_11606 [Fusarium austroafricanum]
MSMILAPYNDAMRIGQGFNSYTHELCIDGAVSVESGDKVLQDQVNTVTNPAQIVSYSARVVEKLSDVVESMNVSYCSSIKKGTVAVSGSSSTIDETTFKTADINIVVTVKVTNQTTIIRENAEFRSIDQLALGTRAFDEAYGDSFISGFINGGEFTGIISLKVLDRGSLESTLKSIKSGLDSKDQVATELSLDTSGSGSSTELSKALKNTEGHISVSWMGGGQIKDGEPWDVDSVFAAAAAFPKRVAECPQRTWAILTKYRSNRSFVIWASKHKSVKALEYDQVSSYTAELFDSYMDYKMLLKDLQNITDDRSNFEPRTGVKDALDTSMETLLCVRSVLREEQSKIIAAIDILSRDPGILKCQTSHCSLHRSDKITAIINRALGTSDREKPKDISPPVPDPKVSDSDGVISLPDEDHVPSKTFNFASLLPAEIWKDVMPVPKPNYTPITTVPSAGTQALVALGGFIQAAPSDDDDWVSSKIKVTQSYESMRKELEQQRAEVTKIRNECDNKISDAVSKAQKAEASREELNRKLASQIEEGQRLSTAAEKARLVAEEQLTEIRGKFQTRTVERDEAERQLIPGEREQLHIFYINYAGTPIHVPVQGSVQGSVNATIYETFYALHQKGVPFSLLPAQFAGIKAEWGIANKRFVHFVYRLGKTGAVEFKTGTENTPFCFDRSK